MPKFTLACRSGLCAVICAFTIGCEPREDLLDQIPSEDSPVMVESPAVAASDEIRTAPPAAHSGAGTATYTTPPGWESRPPSSSMRIAEWALPGNAVCALFSFPGGGTVEANFERWLGEFTLPDGADVADAARRMSMNVGGVPVEFLQVAGTYHPSNPAMNRTGESLRDHALLGAVFSVSPAPYFLKCTGPEAAIQAEAQTLTEFVSSFEFH